MSYAGGEAQEWRILSEEGFISLQADLGAARFEYLPHAILMYEIEAREDRRRARSSFEGELIRDLPSYYKQ